MALDHYFTLGRSGLRVSRLALGTMTFGTDGHLGSWGAEVAAAARRRCAQALRWHCNVAPEACSVI